MLDKIRHDQANLYNFMCNTGVGVHIWSSLYKFLDLELGVHQATFQSDGHEIMMTYIRYFSYWRECYIYAKC